MRTRPKLLETALRQYITRETGVDLIRVGEIEVRLSAFVFQLVYFIVFFRFLFSSFSSNLAWTCMNKQFSAVAEWLERRTLS